jgi:hypothetical protein
MRKTQLNDAILADVLGELVQVHESVNELPNTLQRATNALTVATNAAKERAEELKETADKTLAASVESTKARLAEAVSQIAERVSYNTTRKGMLQWVVGCLATVALCFTGFGYLLFSMGHEAGYEKGMADTVRSEEYQKAACAWSESPEGEMALGLYSVGVLRNLYTCDNPGWVIEERKEGRVCIPNPDSQTKQSWGWQLPPRSKSK